MFNKIKDIFSVVSKVIGVFSMAVTLTEAELADGESSVKEQKALDMVDKAMDELVDNEVMPSWAREIFFTEFLSKYIVSILVKVAHEIDFFLKKEE